MLRWSIFLSAYDYMLHNVPGKSLGHADALSYLPLPDIDIDPSPAHSVMLLETLPQPPLHAMDVTIHSCVHLLCPQLDVEGVPSRSP